MTACAGLTPYYDRDGVILLFGDMRDVLAALPENSVSCCVTSPPFWGLRKYDCPPSVWGGEPDCGHEWGDGNERQDERYTGRRRWQHIAGIVQEANRHQVQGPTSQRKGRSNVEAQRNDYLKVRDLDPNAWGHPKVADTHTCSLCGAWRGWYGLEPTVVMYVEHTIEVLRAIRRVLRKDGVVWWDLDDSRGGSGKGHAGQHPGPKQASNAGSVAGLPSTKENPKSLCLIPQRVAIAAQEDGWIVRSQVIIPSWMPESARDRPTDAYRTVLMLCKSKTYWYDAAAVRVLGGDGWHNASFTDARDLEVHPSAGLAERPEPSGRNLGNIWDDIPPSAYPAAHFATFPVEEPERCIKASCPAEVCVKCGKARVRIVSVKKVLEDDKARAYMPEGPARLGAHRDALRREGHRHDNPFQETHEEAGWTDCGCGEPVEPGLVLDPFIGTGTTAVAAVKLGRRCIGIDLSEDYLKQAVTRLTVGDAGVRRMVKAARDGARQEPLL